jgi:aryl-alcohol dehydrogenase-like predicted oxidoreductase
MRYRTLGPTGLRVSELALGAMRLPGEDPAECRAIFTAYAEAGGNFIDTADRYGTEPIVKDLLGAEREHFVVGTKFTLARHDTDLNAAGSHRKNLVTALDESLSRLGTDYVDIYWVHARDLFTPVEETMRALDDQVRAGKVLYVAVSDWPAWEVARANMMAELRGWTPFAALQVEYSLLERTVERELVPMALATGLTVTAWSPLAGGKLARPGDGPVFAAVGEVADRVGATRSQVALAWLRSRQGVIPLLGARTHAQLTDALGVLDVQLSAEDLALLDEVSRVELGFPHDFVGSDPVRDVIHGPGHRLIDG